MWLFSIQWNSLEIIELEDDFVKYLLPEYLIMLITNVKTSVAASTYEA